MYGITVRLAGIIDKVKYFTKYWHHKDRVKKLYENRSYRIKAFNKKRYWIEPKVEDFGEQMRRAGEQAAEAIKEFSKTVNGFAEAFRKAEESIDEQVAEELKRQGHYKSSGSASNNPTTQMYIRAFRAGKLTVEEFRKYTGLNPYDYILDGHHRAKVFSDIYGEKWRFGTFPWDEELTNSFFRKEEPVGEIKFKFTSKMWEKFIFNNPEPDEDPDIDTIEFKDNGGGSVWKKIQFITNSEEDDSVCHGLENIANDSECNSNGGVSTEIYIKPFDNVDWSKMFEAEPEEKEYPYGPEHRNVFKDKEYQDGSRQMFTNDTQNGFETNCGKPEPDTVDTEFTEEPDEPEPTLDMKFRFYAVFGIPLKIDVRSFFKISDHS